MSPRSLMRWCVALILITGAVQAKTIRDELDALVFEDPVKAHELAMSYAKQKEPDAYLVLGLLSYQAQRYEDAVKWLEKAEQTGHLEALFLKGQVQVHMGLERNDSTLQRQGFDAIQQAAAKGYSHAKQFIERLERARSIPLAADGSLGSLELIPVSQKMIKMELEAGNLAPRQCAKLSQSEFEQALRRASTQCHIALIEGLPERIPADLVQAALNEVNECQMEHFLAVNSISKADYVACLRNSL
ncbi:hypothetical protein ACFSJ3_14910 [Corallincola platygyrae]|uniref:Sel1 repeat family protein n=1 Tax=Corallincola platygyrae TaxID=1193278 RepID=A0ABW4XR32_9GAMM